MLEKYAKTIGLNIKVETSYNPLSLESVKKVIHLVSATRLNDKVKGGERTLKLIDALDKYCKENNRNYIWTIFTNSNIRVKIDSPNVVLMKPRIDVRPYIADCDYVVQLSDDMETYCYTINEALGYGVPIVTTPLSICRELRIDDKYRIELNYDCSNVQDVARQIFENDIEDFKYNIPKDNWENLLLKSKSNYEEEKSMKFLVQATEKYTKTNTSDNELSSIKGSRYVPKQGEQWEVSYERKELLEGKHFVTVIKEIKESKKTKLKTNNKKKE